MILINIKKDLIGNHFDVERAKSEKITPENKNRCGLRSGKIFDPFCEIWSFETGWETMEEQETFRKFLQLVDEKLPLPAYSNLADPKLAARIHFASGGNMNEIMRLIRAAAVLALKRELPQINLDLLGESFADNLAVNASHLENPFRQ